MRTLTKNVLVMAAFLITSMAANAQNYPSTDTKLYEAAKKEGTVVWYESGPIEPLKEVAADFEKNTLA